MSEQWVEAPRALEIAGSSHSLCCRAKASLVRSRARLLIIEGQRHEDVYLLEKFWWAEGGEALIQDWASGDFSTWVDHAEHWQAFGVTFALSGLLEMLPFDRRGVTARALSVAGTAAWVSAIEARRFAYSEGGLNPATAGRAVIEQARLGFVTARAVLAQGSKGASDQSGWDWDSREWDVPTWFWLNFTDESSSSQAWQTGRFAGRGSGPNGIRWITLTGVHFLKGSLNAILPASSGRKAENAPKRLGGRPPVPFADDLMCAIWALIYQGDLQPKNQAAIERAMLDWATRNGHEISETTAREKARKVFAAISTEAKNSP